MCNYSNYLTRSVNGTNSYTGKPISYDRFVEKIESLRNYWIRTNLATKGFYKMSDKGRILVADSTEALLLPITDLLRIEGYECNYVPDAGTVIEILKYVKFDILIAAINMSKSCALEIIHELPVSAKKIPVILVTDVPLFNAQINSLKTSVTVCLNKPIHFEELLKHVKCSIKRNAYN